MIRKSTYTLVIILLVLAAVVVFLQRTPGLTTKTDSQPTATESPVLLDMGDKTITTFTMTDDAEHILKASLDDKQSWYIEQPSGCQYDSNSISSNLAALRTFTVMVSMEAPPALADVGLMRPTYQLNLTFGDGSTQVLSVGSVVPTGSGYYVQVNHDPVVVVTKASIDALFGMVSTACATPTPEPSAAVQLEGTFMTLTPGP